MTVEQDGRKTETVETCTIKQPNFSDSFADDPFTLAGMQFPAGIRYESDNGLPNRKKQVWNGSALVDPSPAVNPRNIDPRELPADLSPRPVDLEGRPSKLWYAAAAGLFGAVAFVLLARKRRK